jgi:hypothetical protein
MVVLLEPSTLGCLGECSTSALLPLANNFDIELIVYTHTEQRETHRETI